MLESVRGTTNRPYMTANTGMILPFSGFSFEVVLGRALSAVKINCLKLFKLN